MHEAFEMMWCFAGSYLSSLTPRTTVMSGPFAGAVMTTFFAPAARCLAASSRLVKSPVDSKTTSTPRSFQGSCAGSRIDSTLNSSPSTAMASLLGLDVRVQVAEHRVVLEQVRERLRRWSDRSPRRSRCSCRRAPRA